MALDPKTASKPAPKTDAKHSPEVSQGRRPDTVATPEGDGEFAPDQPLTPAPEGLQKPRSIDTNAL